MVTKPMKTADATDRMVGSVMSFGRDGREGSRHITTTAQTDEEDPSLQAAHLHDGCSWTKPSLSSDVGNEQETIRHFSCRC